MDSSGIGSVLRQERLRQSLSLDDIARETRISRRFLEAIETETFELLPGLIFARNFVRQYADALHLDADSLLTGLPRPDFSSAALPATHEKQELSWDPRWNSAIASAAWLVLAIAAAVGAYVYFNRPAHLNAGKNQADIRKAPAAATSAPRLPEPARPAKSLQPPSTPASGMPANAPQSTGTPSPERPVEVLLTAHEPSWVQLTADGKPVFAGTLNPNESRTIAADSSVKIIAGNAGGLEISLNGKRLDPLGRSGEVRVVRLTAEGLQAPGRNQQPAPDPL